MLRPELQATRSTIGQGKSVLLTVVDERTGSVLGTRAGAGVGAEITVEGDLAMVVRDAVRDGLQRQDFTATATKTSEGRELRVEIRNLDYSLTSTGLSSTLRTTCGLKAICIIGPTRPYEQLHQGVFEEQGVHVIKSAAVNTHHLNAALSRALNLLLQDPRLSQCLAQ